MTVWYRDPQVLVNIVATVDAADLALFGASFKAMETSFGFTPGRLGVLQMWQSLSYSVSLPVWGVFLPVLGARYLLCLACLVWAFTTLMTPHVAFFEAQCLLRIINGAALSGVMPITQAILADAVESGRRGAAFGWMQSLHTIARVIVSYAVISLGDAWAYAYYFIFILTLVMIVLLQKLLPADVGKNLGNKDAPKPARLSFSFWGNALRVVRKIMRIPTFVILVLQGVAGGTPWQAMGFLNIYYAALGFGNEQVARITALTNTGAIFGQVFGGYLGDFAARKSRLHGRVLMAQLSVMLGIPAWYIMLSATSPSTSIGDGAVDSAYSFAIGSGFVFYFVSTWVSTGANRPICADVVQEPGERAQIVALWVMIEGVVGSFFGAPLIGFISDLNGYDIRAVDAQQGQNAAILASALFRLGLVCWGFCFVAWALMHHTLPSDMRGRAGDNHQGASNEDLGSVKLQERAVGLGLGAEEEVLLQGDRVRTAQQMEEDRNLPPA